MKFAITYFQKLSLKTTVFYAVVLILGVEFLEYIIDMLLGDGDGTLSTAGISILITLFQVCLVLFCVYHYALYLQKQYPILQQQPFLLWIYGGLLLGINFLGVIYLFRYSFFNGVKYVYYFNTLVMPFTLGLLGIYYWNKGIKNWQVKVSLLAACMGFLLYIYATWLEPQRLQTHYISLKSPKINSKIKVLHISDIQAASIGSYENYVFEQIKALQPDVIIHTGDLIQPANYGADYDTELEKLTSLFKQLKVNGGIYHVLGDTDSESKMDDFAQKIGITYLFNDKISIKIKEQNISIVGLSLEKSRMPNRNFMQELTQKTQPNFTILAGHAPDYMLALQGVASDLCLAGHTHGGQIKIPFWGALVTFSAMPREKSSGYFLQDKIPCNISAGIGAEHAAGLPSIRFNCPPEMTLFILERN